MDSKQPVRKFIPKVKNKVIEPVSSSIEGLETDEPTYAPSMTNNLDVDKIDDHTVVTTVDTTVSKSIVKESSNPVTSDTITTSVVKPIVCIAAGGSKIRPKPVISSSNQVYKVVITDNTGEIVQSVSNEKNIDTSTTNIITNNHNDNRSKNDQNHSDDNSNNVVNTIGQNILKTKAFKFNSKEKNMNESLKGNNKEKNIDESQEIKKKTKRMKKNNDTGLRRKRSIEAVLIFIDKWTNKKTLEIGEKRPAASKNNKKNDDDDNKEVNKSKKAKTNKFEKSSVLPLSFGTATPYTVFSKFVLKRPEGIGLRIKVIDGKAVIKGKYFSLSSLIFLCLS